MSEENKAIARRLCEEFWGTGKFNGADDLLAPDFVYHRTGDEESLDREGYTQDVMDFVNSFTDVQATVEDLVAEGDKVAGRYTWIGRHTGEFLGAPPTGKLITFRLLNIIRLVDGKIAEEWEGSDMLDLEQRIGLIPVE